VLQQLLAPGAALRPSFDPSHVSFSCDDCEK